MKLKYIMWMEGIGVLALLVLVLVERNAARGFGVQLHSTRKRLVQLEESNRARRKAESEDGLVVGPPIQPDSTQQDEKYKELEVQYNLKYRSRGALLTQAQRDIQGTFGVALSTFNLDPAQLVAIKKLLVERILSRNDALELAEQNHLSRQDRQQAVTQAENTVWSDVNKVTDPETTEKLKAMVAASSYYGEVVYNLAPDLAFEGVPLNAQQTVVLANLLYGGAAHSQGTDPSESDQSGGNVAGITLADQQSLEKAQSILGPEQLTAFKALLEKDALARKMEKMRNASMHESN
jgi:hypothetical protein